MILGIDEVGRGSWAGPLVVGAVILGDNKIEGLTDSKKLSKKKREELDKAIHNRAVAVGLGWVSSAEIDDVGLSWALKLATIRAVEQITVPYHEIIIDGTVNFLRDTKKGQYVTTMKKADLLISSVSAASVVAKVARDHYMSEQDSLYPGYGFKNHVGYGTLAHRLAIEELGVTPLHRLSFAPLAKYARTKESGDSPIDSSSQPTTKQIGDIAENEVASYLTCQDHEILARNWKNKFCEIDIVSSLDGKIYFTEVKYRKESKWGDGLEAITKKKLKQMKFAAEFYVLKNKLYQADMRLLVASVTGTPPKVVNFIEI